jgi:hypothetical protein
MQYTAFNDYSHMTMTISFKLLADITFDTCSRASCTTISFDFPSLNKYKSSQRFILCYYIPPEKELSILYSPLQVTAILRASTHNPLRESLVTHAVLYITYSVEWNAG